MTRTAAILQHFLRARSRWCFLRGERLSRYQDRQASRIVDYAFHHSPFYWRHWSGYDLRDWQHLPIIDKQMMMQHFSIFPTRYVDATLLLETVRQAEWARDCRPHWHDLTVGISSGTSGDRSMFLASESEQAAWAGTVLARALHSWRPRRLKVVFFLRYNNILYKELGGLFIDFQYIDLLWPLERIIQELQTLQPQVIVAPPSMLNVLADCVTQGALRIRPEQIISVAEILEEQDQARLQEAFATPIQQIYQCTEGFLAVSCKHGRLHIQEDLIALQTEEVPESEGRLVMPIVTDLWRLAQPIIRYKLNDLLELDPRNCPCGSPYRVILRVEGRSDDLCYFLTRKDRTPHPFFPDTLRRAVLLVAGPIRDYQIVQSRTGQLQIYLEIEDSSEFALLKQVVEKSIRDIIQAYDCLLEEITIVKGVPQRQASEKRRRVRRKVAAKWSIQDSQFHGLLQ